MNIAGSEVLFGDCDDLFTSFVHERQYSSVHVICDENTGTHCLPRVQELAGSIVNPIVIPRGEAAKTLFTCLSVWRQLIAQGADHDSLVVNLGGGMVTDLGGFCAATFQRGITFVHAPTSLMAMCDAALGGKTGVNFDGLKNYIGQFAPPEQIWIDLAFLGTLPVRELRSGKAEMLKHAIIADATMFESLERQDDKAEISEDMIRRSGLVKKYFVDRDPRDRDERQALNFGHTIGHALESFLLQKGDPLLHGECIALGMIAESVLSVYHLKHLSKDHCTRICNLIRSHVSIAPSSSVTFSELRPWLFKDKKSRSGELTFTLVNDLGDVRTGVTVPESVMIQMLMDPWCASQVEWLLP